MRKVIKRLENFFLMFDLYGVPINLLIKRKETYNSILGSLVSLFLIGLTAYSFISMVIDMFERKSPNIIQKIEFTPNPEVFYV